MFDLDGTPEKTASIDHVSQQENGVITIDGERHLLDTGDIVRIEEVEGMTKPGTVTPEGKIFGKGDEVTDINAMHVITEYRYGPKKVGDPKKFSIGNTKGLGN